MSITYMTYKSQMSSPPRPLLAPISFASTFYQKPFKSYSPSSSSGSAGSTGSPPPLNSSQPFFSAVNKISVISLERRIDYHLQRIMKQNRLINFKNSIEALPIEDRISESLLEIIASSNNLILRRQNLIQMGTQLLSQLNAYFDAGSYEEAFQLLIASFGNLKHISSSLGQLIWALNSNKEHIKYVIKVFALPEVYTRPGPDDEIIPLKERIVEMITYCEDTIDRCQTLKNNFHDAIVPIFLTRYQCKSP